MKKHFLFLLPLATLGACQTKSNNENLSQTQSFAPQQESGVTQDDYRVLAMALEKKEYCVVKLPLNSTEPIELWTPQGSLNEQGLRQSLRYAGYDDLFIANLMGAYANTMTVDAGTAIVNSSPSAKKLAPFVHSFGFLAATLVSSTRILQLGEGQSKESRAVISTFGEDPTPLTGWLAGVRPHNTVINCQKSLFYISHAA